MSRHFALPHWALVAGIGLILAMHVSPNALPSRSNGAGVQRICYAIDGDTLRCGRDRIRLIGIDAAELPGHCRRGRHCAPGNPVAQKAVLAAIVRRPVTIHAITTDHWGRTVRAMVPVAVAVAVLGIEIRMADMDREDRAGKVVTATLSSSGNCHLSQPQIPSFSRKRIDVRSTAKMVQARRSLMPNSCRACSTAFR